MKYVHMLVLTHVRVHQSLDHEKASKNVFMHSTSLGELIFLSTDITYKYNTMYFFTHCRH